MSLRLTAENRSANSADRSGPVTGPQPQRTGADRSKKSNQNTRSNHMRTGPLPQRTGWSGSTGPEVRMYTYGPVGTDTRTDARNEAL